MRIAYSFDVFEDISAPGWKIVEHGMKNETAAVGYMMLAGDIDPAAKTSVSKKLHDRAKKRAALLLKEGVRIFETEEGLHRAMREAFVGRIITAAGGIPLNAVAPWADEIGSTDAAERLGVSKRRALYIASDMLACGHPGVRSVSRENLFNTMFVKWYADRHDRRRKSGADAEDSE